MEKALSMFSEDFGSFMRPHSEPLAFPGKCSGPRGEGSRAGRGHAMVWPPPHLQRQVLQLRPRAAAGQMWPDRQTQPGRRAFRRQCWPGVSSGARVRRGLGPGPLWSPEICKPRGRHADPLPAGLGRGPAERHTRTPLPHSLCWAKPRPLGAEGGPHEVRGAGGLGAMLEAAAGPQGLPLHPAPEREPETWPWRPACPVLCPPSAPHGPRRGTGQHQDPGRRLRVCCGRE